MNPLAVATRGTAPLTPLSVATRGILGQQPSRVIPRLRGSMHTTHNRGSAR